MNMDKILNIVAFVTLVEMMIYVGLSASVADFLSTVQDGKLVARGILANYIVVPAVAVGLLLAYHAHPLVAVGFLILAVCRAGPYGSPYTAIAKGNVGAAAGLMVVLVGLSPILSPMLLKFLVPIVSGDQTVKINVVKIVTTLLVGQALPLLVGLAIHHWQSQLAAKLLGPAEKAAKVLNEIFLLLVLYSQFRSLLEIRLLGFIGMVLRHPG